MPSHDQDNAPPLPTEDTEASPPPGGEPGHAVSLMITRRQKAALRDLGVTEEEIRHMTPAEAHGRLGL